MSLEERKNKLVEVKETDIIQQIVLLNQNLEKKYQLSGFRKELTGKDLIDLQEKRLRILKWCKKNKVEKILERFEGIYNRLCERCKLSILGSEFYIKSQPFCPKHKNLYLEAVLLLIALGVRGR